MNPSNYVHEAANNVAKHVKDNFPVSSRIVTGKTYMEMRKKKFHQTRLSLVARTLTCGLKLIVNMQETIKSDDHAQVT